MLGTHEQPFPRALDMLAETEVGNEHVLVQHGFTPPRPELLGTDWVRLLPFDEIVRTMNMASAVVCHGGVGTILLAIDAGHQPVVIPRLSRWGEHVDDHQLQIAESLAARGALVTVNGPTQLTRALQNDRRRLPNASDRGAALARRIVYELDIERC